MIANSLKYLNKTFALQQDQTDCGVACLLSIIQYYGGNNRFEKLRELSGTQVTGTTMLGLYQCAQKLGFDVKGVKINIDYLRQQVTPCILHVIKNDNLEHYIVFYGSAALYNKQATGVKYIIGDPEHGIAEMCEDDLLKIWKSSSALTLSPSVEFKKQALPLKNKWLWFKNSIIDDVNILTITILLGIFITVLGLSVAIFYQKLIDDILPQAKLTKLFAGMILLGVILISKCFLNFLRQHFILMQSKKFNERITGGFLNALFYLPKSFFDHRKTGDMIARLNDTQRIQKNIAYIIGTVCTDILVSIVTIILLFCYSEPVAWLSVCFIPVIVFTVLNFVKPIKLHQQGVMVAYSGTESSYVDHIQGISTIKENNKEPVYVGLNRQIFANFQQKTLGLGNIGNKFSLASELLSVFMLVSILMFSCYLVIHKQIKIGEMVAILSMIGSLLPSIHRLAQSNLQIQEAKVAFDRMYEFAAIKPEYEVTANGPKSAGLSLSALRIEKVSFGFPGRKLILRDISLHVKKGELIALIGESGCGKSTVLQLLQRFYQPEYGEILINDIDVNNYEMPQYRQIIATVPQEIKIFNASLIENITLSKDPDLLDELYNFCEKYGFDKYFMELPQGYLTIIGEEGINLSGGQKQLVALARALFKQPQLLLLDEATSALDRNTEHFIFSLLDQLKHDLAIIMVTHRLNTIKNADRIYIIDEGAILGCGDHISLMMEDNFYSSGYASMQGFTTAELSH